MSRNTSADRLHSHTTREQSVERLHAAAEADARQDYQEGKAAGRAWATDDARPKQLRRLERDYSPHETFACEPDAYGWAGLVHNLLNNDFSDRSELNEFWARVLGDRDADRIHDEDFARGFVEGAIEFWEEVQHEV